MPKVSIVFRALNEARWFGEAIKACQRQDLDGKFEVELLLVDSGSTDGTIELARKNGVRVLHIKKSEFTFGRSLNIGCDASNGDVLVFLSAHCIPEHVNWLTNLIQPIFDGKCDYSYGRQIGHESVSRFSEKEVFAHYYGTVSQVPQEGFFCNNANSAIRAETWKQHRFDESVTGLEDMVLAKALCDAGGRVGYVADAPVIHIHEEDLRQTYRRYFREALVMRGIMPHIHFNLFDFARCAFVGIAHDLATAFRLRRLIKETAGIFGYRLMQYWGTYRGHNEHRTLSNAEKEKYYYPRVRHRRREKTQNAVYATTENSGVERAK